MPSFQKLARTAEWFQWKIPPLLAVGYAAIFINELPFQTGALALLILIFSICTVGAYGYVINDVFDIEQDLAAGKSNSMANLSPVWHFGLLLLFVLLGFAALSTLNPGSEMLILLGANYLLPTLYSVPPVRWKERGIFGALADTSAAHLLPTLLIIFTLNEMSGVESLQNKLLIIFAPTWAFFVGLRGIINHQLLDLEDDRKIGVVTFAGSKSRESIRTFVLRFCYPLELLALIGFLGSFMTTSPLLTGAIAGLALLEIGKWGRGWKFTYFFPEEPDSERYLPFMNNEFYEAWLPLLLAFQLLALSPLFGVLVTLHILLFRKMLWARMMVYRKILSTIFQF